MHRAARLPTSLAHALFAALLAGVMGTAAQLQQAQLWNGWVYGCFLLLALAAWSIAAMKNIAISVRTGSLILAMASLGFGATGLRAVGYQGDALPSPLEGRDLQVTGVVANLPQRNETGLRFRLQVESAHLHGQAVRVPQYMDVGLGTAGQGWRVSAAAADAGSASAAASAPALFAVNRLPAEVQAGERWQMTLRLKAPHGSRNPHGFDYELWLWEQGVQATAYVRATAKDPVPVRLGQTWTHPVDLARQVVRERIYHQVADRPAPACWPPWWWATRRLSAPDWDVFRATGVAHLVSISGLHITMFAWVAAWLVGGLWRRSARLCLALPAPQCGAGGRCACWPRPMRCFRAGVSPPSAPVDVGHCGRAAPVRAALAVAAGVDAGLCRGGGVRPVGAAATGFLAQLCCGRGAFC
jgi:competence protein ComEC